MKSDILGACRNLSKKIQVSLKCDKNDGYVTWRPVYINGNTGWSKKMDGIWDRYNLKSTGRIYTFGVLKCSEKFKVLDLP